MPAIKVKIKYATALAACHTLIMTLGLAIVRAPASTRAQYGERIWTPPAEGTFQGLQPGGPYTAPMPFLPFDPAEVPVYLVPGTTNCFVFDDSQIDYSLLDELRSLISANTPDPTGGGDTNADGGTPDPPWDGPYFGPNDFWLELLSVDTANMNTLLTLHGTKQGFYYELLQKLDLKLPVWTPSPVFAIYDSNGTNQVYFDPAPNGGRPITFYRGVQGFPVVSIVTDRYLNQAIEPNSANSDPGAIALFDLSLSDTLSSNLTVFYKITGSADNGVDYTNLSGTITILAGNTLTNIVVQPIEDNIVEFEETVKLTLVITNGYVIDPAEFVATVTISDNYGTGGSPFTLVTNLDSPVGIDYSPPLQSLLVSIHEATDGETNNFVRLYTNAANQLVVTNWSGVHGAPNEVKLATVKSTIGGFTNGDMFFGSDANVGWLSADGTTSNLTWCTLTNAAVTNAQVLRGGLYVDQTGVWSNNLIAIASDQNYTLDPKGVWQVDAQQHPTFVANITTTHLEGAITVPNISAWGPWAGTILTGDENARDEGNRFRPIIYSVSTNGDVSSFTLDIEPEDFDIIPTNQDLYCTIQGDNASIVKLPSALFTNYVGQLLITQEGSLDAGSHPPRLFIVKWDASATNFVIRSISSPGGQLFEHVTFAPIQLPSTPISP